MRKLALVIIGVLIAIAVVVPTDVKADYGENYDFYVYPVAQGKINEIDAVNSTVHYNGTELILRLELYDNQTIVGFGQTGNFTAPLIYSVYVNETSRHVYIYDIKFTYDGIQSWIFYMSGGGSERVLFNVSGTDVMYLNKTTFDILRRGYNMFNTRRAEISEIMGAVYPETPEGCDAAEGDAIDDSRALRQGPTVFGENMLIGLLMIIISPYTILWGLLIIAIVLYSRKSMADKLNRIMKEREEMDLDSSELNLAASIQRERQRALMGSTKKVCAYLGIRPEIWRYISKDYSTVGSLCAAFDDTAFHDDGRIDGPIAKSLTSWISTALTLEQRNKSKHIRLKYEADFLDSMKRILNYVSAELHFKNYEPYIAKLDGAVGFIDKVISEMRPAEELSPYSKPVGGKASNIQPEIKIDSFEKQF